MKSYRAGRLPKRRRSSNRCGLWDAMRVAGAAAAAAAALGGAAIGLCVAACMSLEDEELCVAAMRSRSCECPPAPP